MGIKHGYILLLFLAVKLSGLAQTEYDIIMPNGTTTQKNCQRCLQIFAQTPKEVQFRIITADDNVLYLETNSKQWFDNMFQGIGDGVALDIVAKDTYACDKPYAAPTQIRGKLLQPVFTSALKKGLKSVGDNLYRTPLGKIPNSLKNKELEFNILFLNNYHLCQYYTVFNIEAYRWNILEMGMYLDAITYKDNVQLSGEEQFTLRNKKFTFIIPFEKNKAEYSPEDIRPMYDSLRLTDYNIKRIDIQAYSSVEGNLQHNIELQEQRAASIVKALQSFQKPSIETKVTSAENWVEFLNDIENTPFSSYKNLNKSTVKAKLIGTESQKLEPILKNHRKAVILLDLEKIDRYETFTGEQLIAQFNTAIANDKLEVAKQIQNSIFQRIVGKQISPQLLNTMEIPHQLKYIDYLNDNAAIKTIVDEAYLIIARDELKKLEKIAPKNKKIKYNLAVLKFKIWRYNVEPIEEKQFLTEINGLKGLGIENYLIKRMLLNYNIIQSENFNKKRDYTSKDQSVAKVQALIKDMPFSDADYLSLAQYLAYYSNYEEAVELLNEEVNRIEVSEDLLFYYLNLTIINPDFTNLDAYRVIMLNAINIDKNRYCKLFDSNRSGGVTFQLLDNSYLKDTYCENCAN